MGKTHTQCADILPFRRAELPWESKAKPEIPGISQLPTAWLLPFRAESLLLKERASSVSNLVSKVGTGNCGWSKANCCL